MSFQQANLLSPICQPKQLHHHHRPPKVNLLTGYEIASHFSLFDFLISFSQAVSTSALKQDSSVKEKEEGELNLLDNDSNWYKLNVFHDNIWIIETFIAVDGSWGEWSEWSGCSKRCGGGSQTRSRHCNSPSPSDGGADCQGEGFLIVLDCNTKPCKSEKLKIHTL